MWKVVVLRLVVALVLVQAAPNGHNSDTKEKKLHCSKFCSSFRGDAHFEEKSATCRCLFIDALDDAEIALFRKNAKLLNLRVESTLPQMPLSNTRQKRRIPRNRDNALLQDDPILGQRPALILPKNRPLVGPLKPALAPGILPAPHLPIVPPPVLPLHPGSILPPKPLIPPNSLTPISHAEAARRLTDLRQRVRNLARNSNIARNAQAHVDAIKASLDNLSKRIVLNPDLQARTAVNRARIAQARNARLNNLKILPRSGLLPHKPGVLGSAADDSSTPPPSMDADQEYQNDFEDDAEIVNPQNFPKPIITQPKEFYDD